MFSSIFIMCWQFWAYSIFPLICLPWNCFFFLSWWKFPWVLIFGNWFVLLLVLNLGIFSQALKLDSDMHIFFETSKCLSQILRFSFSVLYCFSVACFYLNCHKLILRLKLWLLSGIEPWSFEQQLGEAIFIPAGCPFQVRNLQVSGHDEFYEWLVNNLGS